MNAPTGKELHQLLVLSAKAINMSWLFYADDHIEYGSGLVYGKNGKMFTWSPHIDCGDSRRLAVALGIAVTPYPIFSMPKHSVIAKLHRNTDQIGVPNPTEVVEAYGDDPCAATCIAVLRVAAAIGKGMS